MIRAALLRIATRRPPDFIVGGEANPYLRRWWVIPRNRFFNIYLHQFLRSDDDRALHTHPYLFNVSWLLRGNYLEWIATPADGRTPPCDGFTLHDGKISALAYYRTTGERKWRWGPAPH